MFDFDSLREIFSTISKNKMRTALTSFAVAWGILMLIILLAAGNGLRNGIMHNFADRANNTVTVWPGYTSMPYKGMSTGRRIIFDDRDLKYIKDHFPEVEYISATARGSADIEYKDEYVSITLNAVTPDYTKINYLNILQGRFINELDMKHRRKKIVLHPNHVDVLFGDEDPIGKFVKTRGLIYQVVGVFEETGSYSMDYSAYIPLDAADIVYRPRWGYRPIEFTVNGLDTKEKNDAFIEKLRVELGKLHRFDPADRSTIHAWSTAEAMLEINDVLGILTIFIVIIGVASLMAGIVGVSNIMLITVKERTREIGIRKAIGATSGSVLRSVIIEAVLITTMAGYLGILLGVGFTEFASERWFSGADDGGFAMFLNPTIGLSSVFWATALLVVCGTIAGAIPAMRATRVKPIEAMRAD